MRKPNRSQIYKQFREALPEELRENFDRAPDLDDPNWAKAMNAVLYTQYMDVSERYRKCEDSFKLGGLARQGSNLVDQMRKLKYLHSVNLKDAKRPIKVTVRPFEDGEAVTPDTHG